MPTIPLEKRTRLALGITQQEMATLLQVSRSTIAMAESGKRPLNAKAGKQLLHINQQMEADVLQCNKPKRRLPTATQLQARIRRLMVQLDHNSIIFNNLAQDMRAHRQRIEQQQKHLPKLLKHQPPRGTKLVVNALMAATYDYQPKCSADLEEQMNRVAQILARATLELERLYAT